MSSPDKETLEILQRIEGKLDDVRFSVDDLAARQKTQGVVNQEFRERMRLMIAAMNDMAGGRLSAGEIRALHDDVNGCQARIDDLTTEINRLKP